MLQEKISNYETDLFTPLIAAAMKLTRSQAILWDKGSYPEILEGEDYDFTVLGQAEIVGLSNKMGAASLRIIADHARASTFLISDGVLPSNEGRGYVLRKILRRGIWHGRQLGQEKPFMHEMVYAVRDEMVAAYPELGQSAERVAKVVLAEEEQFARVMLRGSDESGKLISDKLRNHWDELSEFLLQLMRNCPSSVDDLQSIWEEVRVGGLSPGDEERVATVITTYYEPAEAEPILRGWRELVSRKPVISGRDAFRLYETFGLPLDFMVDAARDAGLRLIWKALSGLRKRSRLGLGLPGRVGRRSRRRRCFGSWLRRSLRGTRRCGWMGLGCWRWLRMVLALAC